jgi:hypothetical protein
MLRISLGAVPLGDDKQAAGIFYEFATPHLPHANGFALTTGISTLSCQVQGMHLDYSGLPEQQLSIVPKSHDKEDTPTASISNDK